LMINLIFAVVAAFIFIYGICFNYIIYRSLVTVKASAPIDTNQTKKPGIIITAIIGWIIIPLSIALIAILTINFATKNIGSNFSGFNFNLNTNASLENITNNTYSSSESEDRDFKRMVDIGQIYNAITYYQDDTDQYPSSLSALAPVYVDQLPTDPRSNQAYSYELDNQGENFSLCAHLEEPDFKGSYDYCLNSQDYNID